jgi:release factor glutamine methyltransferase
MGDVDTALETGTRRLEAAGCETPRLDAQVLLAHVLGRDRTWLYAHPQAPLSENELARFNALICRRERREPVAYLTGHKAFFGLDFEVTPDVLIPRPETELLVETAIQIFKERWIVSNLTIADIGTGSGCIAITLAQNLPGAAVFGIDRSNKALKVARRNAIRHQVLDQITFLSGDLLAPLPAPVDLIVSNPPYISRPELASPDLASEVRQYEPALALDGGEDGLALIQRLLAQARPKLKTGGSLLIEIGSTQGHPVSELAKAYFPNAEIQIKKDLAGLDRLLVIHIR